MSFLTCFGISQSLNKVQYDDNKKPLRLRGGFFASQHFTYILLKRKRSIKQIHEKNFTFFYYSSSHPHPRFSVSSNEEDLTIRL